ncbi:MAG: PilT/PilU family type 4a pilus ATPase [Actinobacteria bacterium]|nr:PilT/PilU family type 4a pilus ATPase [Actinomycetota bacterium]
MIVPDLLDYLRLTSQWDGSDLHLKAGGPAYIRVSGALHQVDALPALTPEDTATFIEQLMPEAQREAYENGGEADFAYSVAGLGRFRVAAFRQRSSAGLVLRRVLGENQTLEQLRLPAAVRGLAEEHRGLVLVTGPTGSGKTTTTAAMLGHINATRRCHVVTIEDPIEILHSDNLAIVDQREIGVDTSNFTTAMRSVARQDPDVIFIGEMRDTETVAAALQAAETGHLVLSTLHTTDATQTVNRVIDLFPPHQQEQTRIALAESLKGVVSQRLVPRVSGGLVAVVEVLVMSLRMREFVLDSDKTDQLPDAIAEGEYYGMQTFDQHLLELYGQGVISMDAALDAATSPHDFRIAARGVTVAG